MEILGRLVDIMAEKIVPVSVIIENGIIQSVTPLAGDGATGSDPRSDTGTGSGSTARSGTDTGSGSTARADTDTGSGNTARSGTDARSGSEIASMLPGATSDGVTIPLPYILPGFIDAHVHIESSLLI